MNTMENMKKVSFAFDGIKQEKKEFEIGGVKVTAVNKIPYEQKIECAKYMAARSYVEDTDNPGYVVQSVNRQATEMQAFLMFYTNANVEGMSIDAVREMYDNLHDDAGYEEFSRYIYDDKCTVWTMEANLTEAVIARIEAKRNNVNSLTGIFDAFLADPDPAATIARNRELNERLIDAMKIVKQGE